MQLAEGEGSIHSHLTPGRVSELATISQSKISLRSTNKYHHTLITDKRMGGLARLTDLLRAT